MSFRSPRIARLTINLRPIVGSVARPLQRDPTANFVFRFCTIALILLLSGCASVGQWWEGKREPSALEAAQKAIRGEEPAIRSDTTAERSVAPPVSEEPLVYWETIGGGKIGNFITGGNDARLERPVAVAVRGDFVYIVDAGQELVVRYDRISGKLSTLVDLKGVAKGEISDIYVAPDLSFYLTDTVGRQVLYFDKKGSLRQTFRNLLNLVYPVGVWFDEDSDTVLIADGQLDHVLIFNKDGTLLSAVGGRGVEPGKFLNITTVTEGPDGYYIAQRIGHHVQVLAKDGTYLYSFAQEGVIFPLAIAADNQQRAFVADYLDNTIKVYERGRFVASIGKSGVGPGEFKRITDLWLDGDFLYVADSLNGRIQIMRIAAVENVPSILDR